MSLKVSFFLSVVFFPFATYLLLPFSDLAERVQAALANGDPMSLEAEWPLQAMTWLSTNCEDRGQLSPCPFPVTLVLYESRTQSRVPSPTLPTVIASSGAYVRDAESLGEFPFCFSL